MAQTGKTQTQPFRSVFIAFFVLWTNKYQIKLLIAGSVFIKFTTIFKTKKFVYSKKFDGIIFSGIYSDICFKLFRICQFSKTIIINILNNKQRSFIDNKKQN